MLRAIFKGRRPKCECSDETSLRVWVREDRSRRGRSASWCPLCHTIRYHGQPVEPLLKAQQPYQRREKVPIHHASGKVTFGVRIKGRKPEQTETPEFKRWFGDSKVVDEHGKPLVVYHGTPGSGFSQFRTQFGPSWFTDAPRYADTYSEAVGREGGAHGVYPVYLRVERPLRIGRNIEEEASVAEVAELTSVPRLRLANAVAGGFVLDRDIRIPTKAELDRLVGALLAVGVRYVPDAPTGMRYTDLEGRPYDWNLGWLEDEHVPTQEQVDAIRAHEYAVSARSRRSAFVGVARDTLSTRMPIYEILRLPGVAIELKSLGYDGIEAREQGATTYAVFYPEQIKSAIGNRGTFDPSDPDIRKAVGADEQQPEKKAAPSKLGTGEHWITVHPNGDDEEGHPVLIKENPDGTHTVIGGAGGALNGLRLTGVRTMAEHREEAKRRAKAKAQQRREAQDKEHQERYERHLEAAKTEGLKGEEASLEATKRAAGEARQVEQAKQERIAHVQSLKKEQQQKVLEQLARDAGWKPEQFSLSDDEKAKIKSQALEQARATETARALKRENLDDAAQLTAKQRATVEKRAQARSEKRAAQTEQAHEDAVLSRVREMARSVSERILNAHEELAGRELGDVGLGDLVHSTMGDTGKGYLAALDEKARERGVTPELLAGEKEEIQRRRAAEKGEEPEAALASLAAMREAAAQSRADRKALAEAAGIREKAEGLPTDAANMDIGQAISLAQAAKKLEALERESRTLEKEMESIEDVGSLPTVAVLRVSPLTDEEALRKVAQDLHEEGRQRAMRGLVETVHSLEATAPIREHRLAGHNALFGEVAQVALGGAGVDPLTADILGEWATANVMARAMAQQLDPVRLEATTRALRETHIAGQVKAAEEAVEAAHERMNAAENTDLIPLSDEISLIAALHQNSEREELVRDARRLAGTALGRLEAAAALNEALMGSPRDRLQISLGATSYEDAIVKARAVGLDEPSVMAPDPFSPTGYREAQEGDYVLHTNGANKFLEITARGMDKLAARLHVDPREAALRRQVLDIQRGTQDEPGWLPEGISRRPAPPSFEYDPERVKPEEIRLAVDAFDGKEELAARLKENVARRLEVGYSPEQIVSALWSPQVRAEAGVQPHQNAEFEDALSEVAPLHTDSARGTEGGKAAKEYMRETARRFRGYHADWLKESGGGPLGAQSIPRSQEARDLAYQIVTREPALQYAFGDVGDLGREGRQAVRDWARRNVFRVGEAGQEPLGLTGENAGAKRAIWEQWESRLGKGREAYAAIQKQWRESDEKATPADSGGMFGMDLGEEKPAGHSFATMDLSDDAAVLRAAREHAGELGYQPVAREAVSFEAARLRRQAAGAQGEEAARLGAEAARLEEMAREPGSTLTPELYPTETRGVDALAREARARIEERLRGWAYQNLFGDVLAKHGDVSGEFDPGKVVTADSERATGLTWTDYLSGFTMGPEGERRAYQSILEKMRGEVSGKFAAALERATGTRLRRGVKRLTYAEEHAQRVQSAEQRAKERARQQSLADPARERKQGRYAEGSLGAGVAEIAAAQESKQLKLGGEEGRSQELQQEMVRTTLGDAAEAELAGMMPRLDIERPAPAADADFTTGDAVKRQRFLRQFDAAHRIGNSMAVGTGKTLASIAAYTDQRAKGKVKRAIYAVPSGVVGQFSGEAIRFVDPEAGITWHSKPGASREERQAAYANPDLGMVVVTHQALRDDLIDALAEHRFGGNRQKAIGYLETAPRRQRQRAMKEALAAKGWDFGMSVVDEGHNLLRRGSAEGSQMANAIDALTDGTSHHISMSADPIRNDGCIHPDTIIEDPVRRIAMPVREWTARGMAPWVWTLDPAGVRRLMQASVPFVKCIAPMYRVVLDNGAEITVAGNHRFLTPEGWRHLREIAPGALLACAPTSQHASGASLPRQRDSEQLLQREPALLERGACPSSRQRVSPSFQETLVCPSSRRSSSRASLLSGAHLSCDHVSGRSSSWRESPQTTARQGVHQGSARGSMDRPSGSRAHCWTCSHPCDGPLPMGEGGGLTSPQRRAGVLEHNHRCRILGAPGGGRRHSHQIHSDRPSMSDGQVRYVCRASSLACGSARCHVARRIVALLRPSLRRLLPSRVGSDLRQPLLESGNHADQGRSRGIRAGVCVQSAAVRNSRGRCVLGYSTRGRSGRPVSLRLPSAVSRHRSHASYVAWEHLSESAALVYHKVNIIDKVGEAEVYDLTVPVYHNYLAQGIWHHNSEAFDFLSKIRPDRYNDSNREEFLRRYATGTDAAYRALALEMAPYHYAESIDPGVKSEERDHRLEPSPAEREAYARVEQLYRRARAARQQGRVDVEAIRALSPSSFRGRPEEAHEEIARRVQMSLGMTTQAALDRVVNTHPEAAKLKKVVELAGSPEESRARPLVVFAHRLEAVDAIAGALKAAGHRVATYKGPDGARKRNQTKERFAPTGGVGEAEYDVLVSSDAGAVGLNLQRGSRVIQYDTPYTALTQKQRTGRVLRMGQKHDVEVHTLATDTPYEHRRREILAGKQELREMLTRASELLDDTGLADRIARDEEALLQQHMRRAA